VHNTLERNGAWRSTKAEAGRKLMAAATYFRSRQTLAGEELDLGRWHGHHEILWREPVQFRAARFSMRLEPDAYLCFVFGKDDAGFRALRLSANARLPTAWLVCEPDGAFERVTPTGDAPIGTRRWHDVVVWADGGATRATVDGVEVGTRGQAPPDAAVGLCGFRGGERSARVDDVEIERGPDAPPFRESFANRRDFLLALAVLVPLLALADLAVMLLARRVRDRRLLARAALAACILLVGTCGIALAAYELVLSRRYPPLDPARERAWRAAEAERLGAEVLARHPDPPRPGTRRVLFIGSSQTWGSGAAAEDETFVARSEALLNGRARDAGRHEHYECINAGVSGLDGPWLLRLYRDQWLRLAPHAVVLDLAVNDNDPEALRAALEGFLALNRSRGIATLLCVEPLSTEVERPADAEQEVVREVAARLGAPVVDLHAGVAAMLGRGFLWWDLVHPTSFGHRTIARLLVPEIERL
jgi:lysophospholipase L1-like esterase